MLFEYKEVKQFSLNGVIPTAESIDWLSWESLESALLHRSV
jgi:hypothetical protein